MLRNVRHSLLAPLLLAPAVLSACAAPQDIAATPVAPPRHDTTRPDTTHHDTTGMVSTADARAGEAGVQMLREGGNALDAALAILVALTVIEPQSSGIGGGSFMVLDPGDGQVVTYDGRETAPAATSSARFLRGDGTPMPFREAVPGGLSTGVPGNVAMMALAHEQHGSLPWAKLFEPAIALARNGFAVTPRLHDTLTQAADTGALSAEARAMFYPGGEAVPVGTIVRNPALADYLETLAADGPEAFYDSANAAAIVGAVQGATVNPGDMTEADLASYVAKRRGAVCGEYRLHLVCGMGPPSSGATTVIAILKQLERFDLSAMGPNDPVFWHLFAESQRLAYADRALYLADSDYVDVPVAGLTDPEYLSRRSQLIRADATMPAATAGTPPGAASEFAAQRDQVEHGTSHFVAVDGDGMIVSNTSTVESAFGSGLMVNGYYLNNELTDFSFLPTEDGKPVANRVEPGKRPRSSMSPTIVYGPDGAPRLAVGAAGGSTIIVQTAKAIIGTIDFGLSAQDAIALPFLFAPGDVVMVEPDTDLIAMLPALRALGHADAREGRFRLKANAVEWVAGVQRGAADPRSEGAITTP